MPLSNDERGWVMTGLSGVACVVGAAVICVDIIVRQFPGKKNFRIQDSDAFLSASLSLSFGVMLFSSLYSMLPSAKSSLQDGGFSSKAAAWTLVGCFIGGVVGIQIVSKLMHSCIPSHVVDCEHTHDDKTDSKKNHKKDHHGPYSHGYHDSHPAVSNPTDGQSLSRQHSHSHLSVPHPRQHVHEQRRTTPEQTLKKRPSFHQRITTGIKKAVTGTDPDGCDRDAPCYGFTDPCGSDCFRSINARGGIKASAGGRPPLSRHATAQSALRDSESTPLLKDMVRSSGPLPPHPRHPEEEHLHGDQDQSDESSSTLEGGAHHHTVHHHHVPTNAFLSIGLQTSIAIALHKLPEGFITYATNHANPKLGVAVFLALFIHNITEGFAMALPLYLALNNRLKAMVISFVLGGLSQPLGAAVAAIWFKLAGNGNWAPSAGVYGAMFAVTAGIMASVALSLFSEALDLTHSKNLCMVGAFSGMAILGISSALTA